MTIALQHARLGRLSCHGRSLAAAAQPEAVLTVAQWADARRHISAESGSPFPGPWRNSRVPFAIEIMNCLDADYPCRTVTAKIASQMFKSELALNWIGHTIDIDPAPMGLALPSQNEVATWNQTKWEPMLDATAALKGKVFDIIDRSSKGSTNKFKRFRGGFLSCISASSSKELQGKSVKRGIADEVSEWLAEVGQRGDPLKQYITRSDAHADAKYLLLSTPGELPHCRITKYYDEGDRREGYVQCPECGECQIIAIERLHLLGPGQGAFACFGCGVLIPDEQKGVLIDSLGGLWLKRYESTDENNPAPPDHFPAADLPGWIKRRGHDAPAEGRQPSFWMHQGYSKFKSWAALIAENDAAERGTNEDKRVHQQQKLALAWDPSIDAPDHAKLYAVRGEHVQRGVIPEWACMLIGAADVQGNRIEWAAHAFGPDCSQALVDWGVCEGDPLTDEPWIKLAEVIGRRYPGELTEDLAFDRFGIDARGAKGVTAKVYQFVGRSPGVFALMGAKDPFAMPFAAGEIKKKPLSAGRFVKARINWIGGQGIKKTIMGMLERSIASHEEGVRLERGFYAPVEATEEIFKQLTAEVFKQPKTKRAGAVGFWEKLAGRSNEQLDLAVYAYGMAYDAGLERMSPAEWARLMAARRRVHSDLPLFDKPMQDSLRKAAAVENEITESGPAASPSAALPGGALETDSNPAAEKAPPPADAQPEDKPAPRAVLGKNPSANSGRKSWMKRLGDINRTTRGD